MYCPSCSNYNNAPPHWTRDPWYTSYTTTDYVQVVEAENILSDKNVEIPPAPGPAPVISAWELFLENNEHNIIEQEPQLLNEDQHQPELPGACFELSTTIIGHEPPPTYSSLGLGRPRENVEAPGPGPVVDIRTLLVQHSERGSRHEDSEENPIPDTASALKVSEWLASNKDQNTFMCLDESDLPPSYDSLGIENSKETTVKK